MIDFFLHRLYGQHKHLEEIMINTLKKLTIVNNNTNSRYRERSRAKIVQQEEQQTKEMRKWNLKEYSVLIFI
jgi:hypothetical protein